MAVLVFPALCFYPLGFCRCRLFTHRLNISVEFRCLTYLIFQNDRNSTINGPVIGTKVHSTASWFQIHGDL